MKCSVAKDATGDTLDVSEIAKAADVDERSVWKALAGGRVRGRAGARIRRVLIARGRQVETTASVSQAP